MKFSEQWLREWVNPQASTEELTHTITMAGLEVDGIEGVASEFSGVVVGEILSAEQHPDADKLRVCQVSDGTDTFQVVCGAPNARAGLRVAFAKVKAVLPGDFKIKKAKLRGVESLGMLCGEDEIGLGDDKSGIMELPLDAPVGTCVREYLNLNDVIIDVDLTPNRADCLSLAGLAREVGVNFRSPVSAPAIATVAAEIEDTFAVSVSAPAGCPRYVARVIRDVDVTAATPLWMKERLRRSGVRSIDPVVDVTNYVLLELGQPMHGFDLNKLSGAINVRMAEQGEKLTLLDGQEIELNADTLVIADQSGALAIAGVMGGESSSVTSETRDVLLESAFFEPITIAGKARSYGLHTDSSHRFERGVDFTQQERAIERATALIVEICGGKPGPVEVTESIENLPTVAPIRLRASKVESLLGLRIPNEDIVELLTRLGLEPTATVADEWMVAVPSYRFDIALEVDLIEELGRIYGYNRLPVTTPQISLNMKPRKEALVGPAAIRQSLVALGYQEAINYSFIDPKLQQQFEPGSAVVELANPISAEMSVMRTSLLPGLVKTLQYNLNRQQSRVRLFESGQTFVRAEAEGEITQDTKIGGLIYGAKLPEGWAMEGGVVDFFDLKGDIESLLDLGRAAADFRFVATAEHGLMHPGQCAQLLKKSESGEQVVGHIGALHPSLQADLGIDKSVYLFEFDLALISEGVVAKSSELSKFPEVRRDLAVVVDQTVGAGEVQAIIRENAAELLTELSLFDVYVGKGIDPNRKSLALGLTLQHPSRTLNDEEVNELFAKVVAALEEQVGASLRV